jgi:hypothetical protein
VKRILSPFVLALIFLASLPGIGSATLIVDPNITNTAELYSATVYWEQGGNSVAETLTTAELGFAPWALSLFASQVLGLEVTFAMHAEGPHAGDVNPNPNSLLVSLLGVTPGAGAATGSNTVVHPTLETAEHFDRLIVSVQALTETRSAITISAVHMVPEPGSVSLAVIGASVLFLVRKRLGRVQ